MFIGGVMLGSGMELALTPGDYENGDTHLRFMIVRIIAVRTHWIALDGMQRPGPHTVWQARQIHVRITALKRSLVLAEAA